LVLAFGLSVLVGYGYSSNSSADSRGVTIQCEAPLDLLALTSAARKRLGETLRGRTSAPENAVAASAPDAGAGSTSDALAPIQRWAEALPKIERGLFELNEKPSFRSLAALHDALGLELTQCARDDQRWPDDEAVEQLAGSGDVELFDLDWAKATAAAGCKANRAGLIEALLANDRALETARAIAAALAELNEPAPPQARLQQLTALDHSLQRLTEDGEPVSFEQLVARAGLDLDAYESVAHRVGQSKLVDAGCLPQSRQQLEALVVEARDERAAATGVFTRDDGGWHWLSQLSRVQAVLDAFFDLSFVERHSPDTCSLSDVLAASRWEPEALFVVRNALRDYRATGFFARLSGMTAGTKEVAFPAVWAALPLAACAKITLNLCVELNDTLQPMNRATASDLTRLRQQAASIEQTEKVWDDVRAQARDFGCDSGVFGLDAADQFSRMVLDGADEALRQATVDAFADVEAVIERPDDPRSKALLRDPAARLVLYRREVAALTHGVALPALDVLKPGPSEDQRTQDWQKLAADLATPEARRVGGAPASAGQSGLFAFERFYAELLSRGTHACSVPFDSWRSGVFAAGQHGFYARARSFASKLEHACAEGHEASAGD
jgi:hypothetical protein